MNDHCQRTRIRRVLLNLSLAMLFFQGYAQSEYIVRGKVTESSGKAIAYANIILRDVHDSSLIGGTITDETGHYLFRLPEPGKYLLNARFIGYEPVDTVTGPEFGDAIPAMNIMMQRAHRVLEEVVIRKRRKKARQQADLTTYYVNSHMKSASGTAVDMISHVPGITVDLMHTVSLNGSKQIKILVNGVERDASYLSQLDADRIDRIDIRSTGGVQYDAGITGVINVILKDDPHTGMSGHVYVNIPTRSYEVFSFPSASLSYSRNNTTWYASYNGSFSYFNIEGRNEKLLSHGNQHTDIIRTDSLKQENWSHKLHVGVDHFSSKKTQFSLYGFVSGFSNEQDGLFEIKEVTDLSAEHNYSTVKDDLDRNLSAYGSVYLKHRFNPSNTLTLEGNTYLLQSQQGLFLTPRDIRTPQDIRTLQDIHIPQVSRSESGQHKINLRTRFSSTLTEEISFETGMEQQLHNLQDNLFPSYTYSQRVFAGYMQGVLRVNPFHLQTGLRAEHSRVISGDVLDTRQVFFLPQINLKYNINKKQSFMVHYGKQIHRPQNHQLNPNPYRFDKYTLLRGNPGLLPEIIHNLSAAYSISFRENFVSIRIFHRQEHNVIEDLTTLTDSGTLSMEKQNLGNLYYAGMKVSGSVQLHDKVSLNTDFELAQVQSRVNDLSQNQGIKNKSGMEVRGKIAGIWAIDEDFSLSASMQFQSPSLGIQHRYREGILYFISLDKMFFNRLKVSLTSALPGKRSFTYQGYEIEAPGFTVTSEDQIRLSWITAWVKLKYSFSSGSKVRQLKRDQVFEENRVNKGF